MKDLSHLKAPEQSAGWLPDKGAKYAPVLAQAWADELGDTSLEFSVPESRIRHSWAGNCARSIAYEVIQREAGEDLVTEPLSVADHWRFGIGTAAHEKWQEVMQTLWDEAQIEVTCSIPEVPSSGHIDLVMRDDERKLVAMELKTINGFGFKMAVGARGEAEGPRSSAVTQGALNGYSLGADEVVIVYLSLENLSPRELAKIGTEEWQRFSAEWTIPKDVFMPIAEREVKRFKKILEVVDAEALPPRAIPDLPQGARVSNPATGAWLQFDNEGAVINSGSTWHCAYCPFRSRCIADG